MSHIYSEDIASKVRAHLDAQDWNYTWEEDDGVFHFGLSIRGNIQNIRYLIDIRDDFYTVYVTSPLSGDRHNKAQMRKLAEFLHRANYGLRCGNFEMDFNDGEIRYKSYVNCDGIELSDKIVEESIHCPAAMFIRYGQGIVKIIFAGMDPKDAVEMCENPQPTDIDDDEDEDEDVEVDEDEDDSSSGPANSHLMELLRQLRASSGDD